MTKESPEKSDDSNTLSTTKTERRLADRMVQMPIETIPPMQEEPERDVVCHFQ